MLYLSTVVAIAVLPFFCDAAASPAPSGLLVDFQKSPALGIKADPHFTWIVPACSTENDHQQTAYQIKVTSGEALIWDSGKIPSNESTYAPYNGPALKPATGYHWTVSTWTESSSPPSSGISTECASSASTPGSFVTSLFTAGFAPSSYFIQLSESSTFTYFRKEIILPKDIVSAFVFITARNAMLEDPLLVQYKFMINGDTVDVGPGRGEVPNPS